MNTTFSNILLSSRPVSWVNTAFPFAASYLLVVQSVDPLLIIGTLFFLIPYNLMMYGVNDVFDYESDIRNPRKGGIEGAVLDKAIHKKIIISVIALNVPFIIALLLLGSAFANVVLAFVVFFVLAYSVPKLRFKERPFLDSITSSLHFVGPAIYALSLVGFPEGSWPLLVAFFFWGMASHAFGAVQDVIADREGGIGSIATVLGARSTVWFSALLYTLSVIILSFHGPSAAFVGVFVALYIANVAPYLNITDQTAERANKGWRRFIFVNLLVGAVITMTLIYIFAR